MTRSETRIVTHPALPLSDISPLERLVLSHVMECSETEEGFVLFTDIGPNNPINLKQGEVIAAFDASKQHIENTLNAFIASRVLAHLPSAPFDPEADIAVDLSEFPWRFIVQDVVARSPKLEEVTVIQWINHPSQRPETFGATVSLITKKAIHHVTSEQLLDRFRVEDRGLPPMAPLPWREPEPLPNNSVGLPSCTTGDYLFGIDEVKATLCIWEAMLYLRGLHEDSRPVSDNVRQMSEIWSQVGWEEMRRFAAEITPFALDVKADLADVLREDGYSFDFEFVPAFAEALLWSNEGPYREGEPEEFLEDVVNALKRRRNDAVARHATGSHRR